MSSYVIEITDSQGRRSVRALPCERVLVGRSASACHVSVPDRAVSTRHAELCVANGRISMRDIGSTNGTWYRGIRQQDRFELMEGDTVRLGSVAVRVLRADEEGRPLPARRPHRAPTPPPTAEERNLVPSLTPRPNTLRTPSDPPSEPARAAQTARVDRRPRPTPASGRDEAPRGRPTSDAQRPDRRARRNGGRRHAAKWLVMVAGLTAMAGLFVPSVGVSDLDRGLPKQGPLADGLAQLRHLEGTHSPLTVATTLLSTGETAETRATALAEASEQAADRLETRSDADEAPTTPETEANLPIDVTAATKAAEEAAKATSAVDVSAAVRAAEEAAKAAGTVDVAAATKAAEAAAKAAGAVDVDAAMKAAEEAAKAAGQIDIAAATKAAEAAARAAGAVDVDAAMKAAEEAAKAAGQIDVAAATKAAEEAANAANQIDGAAATRAAEEAARAAGAADVDAAMKAAEAAAKAAGQIDVAAAAKAAEAAARVIDADSRDVDVDAAMEAAEAAAIATGSDSEELAEGLDEVAEAARASGGAVRRGLAVAAGVVALPHLAGVIVFLLGLIGLIARFGRGLGAVTFLVSVVGRGGAGARSRASGSDSVGGVGSVADGRGTGARGSGRTGHHRLSRAGGGLTLDSFRGAPSPSSSVSSALPLLQGRHRCVRGGAPPFEESDSRTVSTALVSTPGRRSISNG